MGTPYSTVAVSGYNSSPPSDDGTQVDSNKVYWSTAKTKLGDPLNTAIAAIDSALVTAFNYTAVEKTADYTTVAGDNGKIIEIGSTVSAAVTITLGQVASMGTSYIVKVVNRSTIAQTVARGGSDTINGSLTSLTIPSKASLTFQVNASNNGYDVIADHGYATGNLKVDGTLNVTGATSLAALTVSGAVIGAASQAVFNTVSTTVNAFGAATTLNIGNSGGTNTVLGATTFSQALTVSGAFIANGAASVISTHSNNFGNLVLQNNDAADNAGISFKTGSSPAGASRQWQIQNNYTTSGDLQFLQSTTSTGNPTTAILTLNASGMNGALGQTTPAALAATTGAFSSYLGVAGGGTTTALAEFGGTMAAISAAAKEVHILNATNPILVIGKDATNYGYIQQVTGGSNYMQMGYRAIGDQIKMVDTGLTTIGGSGNYGLAVNGTGSVTTGFAVGGATPGTGGVAFPATAVAVSDANTLDDYREGTYTGTPSGFTVNTTQTVTYVKTGNEVTLTWVAFTGTSNSTAFTVSGAPAAIRPSATRQFLVRTIDNSASQAISYAEMDTSGVITFYKDLAGNAFTSSGSKAAYPVTISYII